MLISLENYTPRCFSTQEERVEIVAFCIEHGKDYGLAMEKYGVSYQQIYSWVRKYESKGVPLPERRVEVSRIIKGIEERGIGRIEEK